MELIRYELKYCEGCGTLKLRQQKSDNNECPVCERMLERFGFRKVAAKHHITLPSTALLKGMGPASSTPRAGGPQ